MKYFLDRRDQTRGKRFIPYHDIIFILDSSKFLSEENFNLSVITAQNLVTRFDPDTQFASIIFGTNATISFNFHFARVRLEFYKTIIDPYFTLRACSMPFSAMCDTVFRLTVFTLDLIKSAFRGRLQYRVDGGAIVT